MKVLSLSHTDLDGISCQIVINRALGLDARMNCTYGNIDEYIDVVEDYCYNQKPDTVFVTDLSFTYIQLEKLSLLAGNHKNINFFFIDHHPFPEEYKHLSSDNFTIVISKKASATKLTKLFIDKKWNIAQDMDFNKFISYVNAYDIWLQDTPEFKVGFVYNELFWKYGIQHFWSRFSTDTNLRPNNKQDYKDLVERKNKLFKKLDDSGRFLKIKDDLLMVFLDEYQGFLTIDYPGYKVYTIIHSYGRVSVRLTGIDNLESVSNTILSKVKELECVDTAGGHMSAFGAKIKSNEPQELIGFAKALMHIVDEALNN